MRLDTEEIARVAHEVNRAYCEAIGDRSQLPWGEAAEWQKESILKGVQLIVESDATPEDLHRACHP